MGDRAALAVWIGIASLLIVVGLLLALEGGGVDPFVERLLHAVAIESDPILGAFPGTQKLQQRPFYKMEAKPELNWYSECTASSPGCSRSQSRPWQR